MVLLWSLGSSQVSIKICTSALTSKQSSHSTITGKRKKKKKEKAYLASHPLS